MRTIPLVLGNVVLSVYEADASGNAMVDRPVFLGARTERVSINGTIEEFEITGSGDEQREFGQAGQEHELRIGQIWVVRAAPADGGSARYEDFDLRRGRYVIAIYGEDPRSRVYHRRTYYGCQCKSRSEEGDQGQQWMSQEKVFRAHAVKVDADRLAEGAASDPGVLAPVPEPGTGSEAYLFDHAGPMHAGSFFVGMYRFDEAKTLTFASVLGLASQGAATVVEILAGGVRIATLSLPAGDDGEEVQASSVFSIGILANTTIRCRVVSGPSVVEEMARGAAVSINLV